VKPSSERAVISQLPRYVERFSVGPPTGEVNIMVVHFAVHQPSVDALTSVTLVYKSYRC
jgi:hypothetical protein